MTDRLVFEAISGISGKATTNPLTIELSGDSKKLKEIKKMLTVRNKSAAWQVKNAKEKLPFWESRDLTQLDADVADKIREKIAVLKEAIAKNEPLIRQEFYEDKGGSLEVPAGFWWLPESIDGNPHHNTLIKPAFVDGLRDYQRECLAEMFKYNRATGVLATGLGKSLLVASLCVATVLAGRRACVVVPTEYLVGQMFDTISRYVKNTMAYGGKRKQLPLGADVLVVTAQSAAKFIGSYHTIIIDESHHSPATTWVELLTNAELATHVYNLTATAFRSDGMDLAIHAFGGPVVYEKDARWGIENGWLKPMKAYVATLKALRSDGTQIRLGPKMGSARAYKILTENINVMLFAKAMLMKSLSAGRRTLVLFKTVEAGKRFQKVCAPDVKFDVASSSYKKALNDFREGKTEFAVLVSNDRLVSEGVDIPELNCLINVLQNNSPVITYQACGRILRRAPGDALVIDIGVEGYEQFDRAQNARASVYAAITDDVSLVGGVK